MAKQQSRPRRPNQQHQDRNEPDVQEKISNGDGAATAVEAPPAPVAAPPSGGPASHEDVGTIDAETNAKYEQVKGGKLYIKDLQQMDILGLHEIARAEGIQDYV